MRRPFPIIWLPCVTLCATRGVCCHIEQLTASDHMIDTRTQFKKKNRNCKNVYRRHSLAGRALHQTRDDWWTIICNVYVYFRRFVDIRVSVFARVVYSPVLCSRCQAIAVAVAWHRAIHCLDVPFDKVNTSVTCLDFAISANIGNLFKTFSCGQLLKQVSIGFTLHCSSKR